MKPLATLLLIFGFIACAPPTTDRQKEKWKSEIMTVEAQFDTMAQSKGLEEAFAFYAAEDGAIRRGKNVLKGKEAIRAWYAKDVRPNEALTWTPTFVDVSDSGDMAYTYGEYIFSSLDSLGNRKESKGIFHTVWKRQENGEWRFVYD